MANREWFDSKTRRRLQLAIYATLIVLSVAVGVVLSAAVVWIGKVDLPTRLAMLNDVFAGSAVLLGVVAGAIALHAHATATGAPSVQVQVWLGSSRRNELVVLAEAEQNGQRRSIGVDGQSVLHIRLRNDSKFDAQQMRVLATFRGLAFNRRFEGRVDGWRIVDAVDGTGSTALDWISDSWLYADSSLRIPALDLSSLVEVRTTGRTCLELRVFSNNHQRTIEVPVTFVTRPSSKSTTVPGIVPDWL